MDLKEVILTTYRETVDKRICFITKDIITPKHAFRKALKTGFKIFLKCNS
jgi:hypothetical protein